MGRAISELWFEALIFIVFIGVVVKYFLVPALIVLAIIVVVGLIVRELV